MFSRRKKENKPNKKKTDEKTAVKNGGTPNLGAILVCPGALEAERATTGMVRESLGVPRRSALDREKLPVVFRREGGVPGRRVPPRGSQVLCRQDCIFKDCTIKTPRGRWAAGIGIPRCENADGEIHI